MGAWRQPVENYYLFGLRHQTVNQLNLRVGILSTFNESKTLSDHIRIEKELETTIMTTMQEFLSNKRPNILTSDEACSTVIYRPSTSIQRGVSQQTFAGLQDMSSRRLQHVFSVTILRLPRRLEDVLKTPCKDVLKTS